MRFNKASGATASRLRLEFTRIRLGESPQVFHQALQVLDFRVDYFESFGSGFEHTIVHGFNVTANDGQGSAQVMGDIGGHLPAGVVEAVQVGAHMVESRRQFTDLIARFNGHMLLQVAFGHGMDGGSQVSQGMGKSACQDKSKQKRHQGCSQGRIQ